MNQSIQSHNQLIVRLLTCKIVMPQQHTVEEEEEEMVTDSFPPSGVRTGGGEAEKDKERKTRPRTTMPVFCCTHTVKTEPT